MGGSTQHESARPADPELARQPRPSIWWAPAFCDCADLVSQARGAGIPRPKWAARDATEGHPGGLEREAAKLEGRNNQRKAPKKAHIRHPLSRLTDNLQPMNEERWADCRSGTESRHDRIHPGLCSWLGSEERAPSPSLPLQNTLVTFLLGELITVLRQAQLLTQSYSS
jgi:hypothetical protein